MNLDSVIAPAFYTVHHDIKDGLHTHYWLKGGRGSTKSSFISIELILGIIRDENANAVVLRKLQTNLKDSVYNQIVWAIERLGLLHKFRCNISPLKITYRPTGQEILFRGTDDPTKIKSLKVRKGYVKYVWFEEADQFRGMDEIRNINQSLLRGGSKFVVFYSYNPPASARSWVNKEVLEVNPNRYVHHSTYLDVPAEWLGEKFIEDAEHLKSTKPENYAHEYLGEVTGTGTEVFTNVEVRPITNDEIRNFDRLYYGLDFGWVDPYAYNCMYYNANRKTLFVFDELHGSKTSNEKLAQLLKPKVRNNLLMCDSAEPKSIGDLRAYGLAARGAEKAPGSVEYSFKWLQSLEKIVVDGQRCPYTTDELLTYSYELDKDGFVIDAYPDGNDHHLSAIRYAMNLVWKRKGK